MLVAPAQVVAIDWPAWNRPLAKANAVIHQRVRRGVRDRSVLIIVLWFWLKGIERGWWRSCLRAVGKPAVRRAVRVVFGGGMFVRSIGGKMPLVDGINRLVIFRRSSNVTGSTIRAS
jgi:hypothetical protein